MEGLEFDCLRCYPLEQNAEIIESRFKKIVLPPLMKYKMQRFCRDYGYTDKNNRLTEKGFNKLCQLRS